MHAIYDFRKLGMLLCAQQGVLQKRCDDGVAFVKINLEARCRKEKGVFPKACSCIEDFRV